MAVYVGAEAPLPSAGQLEFTAQGWFVFSLQTVLMDQSRFQELQLQLEQLTILGAVLLVTFSMAASGIASQANFAEKLKMIVKILLTDMHLP